MAIFFKDGCFKLDTKNTTYCLKIINRGIVMHEYYGKRISDADLGYIYPYDETRSYTASAHDDPDMIYRPNDIPQEYSAYGGSDFRTTALRVKMNDGSRAVDLRYYSHEITDGAAVIPGMPCATQNGQTGVQTLVITLKDDASDIFVKMYYVVFEQFDVIARFNEIVNKTDNEIYIENAASMQLDFLRSDYDFIQLSGAWARERNAVRTAVHDGIQGFASRRGTSSHQHSPFFVLCSHNCDENSGEAYGCHLVYSGNHRTEIEKDQYGCLRAVMGINDEGFCWQLKSGESFYTPEALLSFSGSGLGDLSRQFHKFICRHIFRRQWFDSRRPLLINNWEATYFDFNQAVLENLAKTAVDLGMEMLVMDDGWFGHRNDDRTSLGDWHPNAQRLPGGLKPLAQAINNAGLKFGIWMEPEMISQDSDLYRRHPDWVLGIPGRGKSVGRHQYVLDLINDEVKEYVLKAITDVVLSANIEYLKWDMNRYLTEVFSITLGAENQGEAYHRYVLAVYDILDKLTNRFPNLLIEHCSGGGGRFDTGMLYYSPQIWTSDDTDAAERIKIQFGTSLGFPVTSMGSHVSAVPNHQTLRSSPLETRANVAFCGTFGYELDINKLTCEEKEEIRRQCEFYKQNYELINYGDFYRIDYEEGKFASWCFVSPDKKDILLFCVQIGAGANDGNRFVRIPGADETLRYSDGEHTYFGDTLKNLGICLKFSPGERISVCRHFKA